MDLDVRPFTDFTSRGSSGPEGVGMITISAFNDREDALISKALLEAAGVPVTLREEEGRLYLLVRETDARQAQALLHGPVPARGRRVRWRRPVRSRIAGGRFGMFIWGGFVFTAASLTFLLLLMPLGVHLRVTPFVLAFLFFFGGIGGLLAKSVRIRNKVPLHRPRL
jgi:hypothetical protein